MNGYPTLKELLLIAEEVTGWRCVIRDGSVWVYPPGSAYCQVFGPVLNRRFDSTGGSMTTYALMVIQWLANEIQIIAEDSGNERYEIEYVEQLDINLRTLICTKDITALMRMVLELKEGERKPVFPVDDIDPIDLEIYL